MWQMRALTGCFCLCSLSAVPLHLTDGMSVHQRDGGKEEVSVNELACYLEDALTLPRPMSYMASLMYN